MLKGDAAWSTVKTVLDWIIDTASETISLPPHRVQRLSEILNSFPRTRARVSLKLWHKVLGELRSMSLAIIPGLRGMFNLHQEAFRHKTGDRLRLTQSLHDFMDDIRWLLTTLSSRLTRLREICHTTPALLGACDTAGTGMGGVFFLPSDDPNDPKGFQPHLWCAQFP